MKSYIPQDLLLINLNHQRIIKEVGEANAHLSRFDGLLQAMVNPEILLSPLITREAVLSSKIEGTQATLDEVLTYDAGITFSNEQKEKDIQEIVNYRSALIQAEKILLKRPLDLFLVRQIHQTLIKSVRGENKRPGEFRKIQNWIGTPGQPIEKARFIPPEPQLIPEFMEKLEKFLQRNDLEILIQTALLHAQFEIIHPFLDGNGRVGRLLIPLFLFYKKHLIRPMFYLSEYFEKNREFYYQKLSAISKENDWTGWVEFFLSAVKYQAEANSRKLNKILQLYNLLKERIVAITHSQYSILILDAIFKMPIFTSSEIIKRTQIPKQTLLPQLKKLQQAKILQVLRPASGRQPAVLVFKELLDISQR